MVNPELKNYEQIERLEALLKDLRGAGEADAVREVGLEIAVAIREVGAMLVNVGWEQSYATEDRTKQVKKG